MPKTKEVPRANGDDFLCPCGGRMEDPVELKPRLMKQLWECPNGCQWERDFSQGGPDWREAGE